MNADIVLSRIKADMQKLSAGWSCNKQGVLTPPAKRKRTRVATTHVAAYELCGRVNGMNASYF